MESSNIKNHLKALVQISIIDRDFGQPEKSYVYTIGKANKIPEEEIDAIVKEVLESKDNEDVNFDGLMTEERFDYLYDIVQLMKIDGEVFLTEIKYCEGIADKLGYDRKVVKKMASRIYSDPAITGNREALMKEAGKYLK
ncbi:MAG: TerB family tellurite resistance protein [Cyclobacteriaceae bacterium]